MIYRIEKGDHKCRPRRLKLLIQRKELQFSVKFLSSCEYNLNSLDQGDINKLFGIGYFLHQHRNSARFGWRWNVSEKIIEIFTYIYDKGVRKEELFGVCELNTKYIFTLEIRENSYYFLKENEDRTASVDYDVPIEGHPFKLIAYQLNPYFGGNQVAPHEMHIELTKL